MPATQSSIDASRIIKSEVRPEDAPVTKEDIELKKQGIQENEAEARQHLANTAKLKPEKKAELDKSASEYPVFRLLQIIHSAKRHALRLKNRGISTSQIIEQMENP